MTDNPSAPHIRSSRLGAELRRLRVLAGLSGRHIANQVGIGQASVSRIENGHQVPSLPEAMAWATAVAATTEQRSTVHNLTEAALNEVESWRARQRGGLSAMQTDVETLEATARTQRCFQPTLVPGLLQTADYARRVFEMVDLIGTNDYPAAVAARMQRQEALHDPDRAFDFVITEAALRWRPGPAALCRAQLDRIRSLTGLDNVSIGVLPVDTDVAALAWTGFNLYDDRHDEQQPFVAIETAHAGLTVSDPTDVATYRRLHTTLHNAAHRGDDLRATLDRITADLDRS